MTAFGPARVSHCGAGAALRVTAPHAHERHIQGAPTAALDPRHQPRPLRARRAQVRMVEARPGIAFVEFQNEAQAAVAMSGLQLFQITPVKAMRISYAKQ